MSKLMDFIKVYRIEVLNNDLLEKNMGISIKALDRKFKLINHTSISINKFHKNYVAKNIINDAKLQGKSKKRYFEELIENKINVYWSDYKSFNRFINNKKQ